MSKCHTKDGKSKRKVSTVTEEDKDYITVPIIAAINEHDPKAKWATVRLQNSEIKAMIDSGSEIDIVGEETFRGLPYNVDQLSPATQKFCGYGPEGKRVANTNSWIFSVYGQGPFDQETDSLHSVCPKRYGDKPAKL